MKTPQEQSADQHAVSKSYPILRVFAVVNAVLSLTYTAISYATNGHKGNIYLLLAANIVINAVLAWYVICAKDKKRLVFVLRVLLVLAALSALLQVMSRAFYTAVPTALIALATYLTLQKVDQKADASRQGGPAKASKA